MMAVTIRDAQPADLPRLVAMIERFLASVPPEYDRDPNPLRIEQVIHQLQAAGPLFVAVCDGAVVGSTSVVALEQPLLGCRYADVIGRWVDPGWRRSSIGTQLLERAEAWGRERGLPFVKAVALARTNAGACYERRGYRAVETVYQRML